MGVYSMAYLNQILLDCLWGTCSSSIRRPRVAQCTRKLAQVTTPATCILYVSGSNFGRDADCHDRKLLRFCPFPPDVSSCRHDWVPFPSSTTIFFFISLFIVIQSFDIICRVTTEFASLPGCNAAPLAELNLQVSRDATLRRWPSGS